jgi:hypothetical protein
LALTPELLHAVVALQQSGLAIAMSHESNGHKAHSRSNTRRYKHLRMP